MKSISKQSKCQDKGGSMTKDYDGWVIKVLWHKNPWLLISFFRPTRTEAIEAIKKAWGKDWKKDRLKGRLKAVKVKLVEVE